MLIRVNYANLLIKTSVRSWRDANKAKNDLKVYIYKDWSIKKKFYFRNPHDMEMCRWFFFKVLLKFKMAATDQLIFLWAQKIKVRNSSNFFIKLWLCEVSSAPIIYLSSQNITPFQQLAYMRRSQNLPLPFRIYPSFLNIYVWPSHNLPLPPIIHRPPLTSLTAK